MYFRDLDKISSAELVPGFSVKFVHGERMTIAYFDIQEGAELPAHSHEHEQISTLLEGKFELTVGEETRVLEPGTSAVIPSNVTHSGRAITNCRIMDVFSPVREDYMNLANS